MDNVRFKQARRMPTVAPVVSLAHAFPIYKNSSSQFLKLFPSTHLRFLKSTLDKLCFFFTHIITIPRKTNKKKSTILFNATKENTIFFCIHKQTSPLLSLSRNQLFVFCTLSWKWFFFFYPLTIKLFGLTYVHHNFFLFQSCQRHVI